MMKANAIVITVAQMTEMVGCKPLPKGWHSIIKTADVKFFPD